MFNLPVIGGIGIAEWILPLWYNLSLSRTIIFVILEITV